MGALMKRLGSLLGIVVLGVTSAFAGNPRWVQVKSPNFTVITDAGEKRGRDTALHFEQMRAVFGTLFVKAKINSSQPLYILAFRNTKEFRSVCPLWNGKPEELAGYFQQGNGVTYIAVDLSTENKWEVVFHEYGHFLLNSNSMQMPPWFDEGFAQFFETVKIEGKDIVFGDVPQGTPEILQQYKWLPIDQLFSVTHDSGAYNERNRSTIFYAESWLAFSHYWFNSPMQKQMIRFLQIEGPRVPADQAIQQAFGMDAKALDKDLQTFYRTGQLHRYRVPMSTALDSLAMNASPVEEIDARARVAELKLQLKDHTAEGVQEFQEIVKEKPDHPIALRGLAYAALRSGDKQKAMEYFRRAASVQSDDPHVYYFSAMLLAQMDAQHNPESQVEMQKDLERAVQLDPNFADAYGMLALSLVWQGKHDEAIPPAEKAVELSPRNDEWAMNLAGFYANAKRYDDAIKTCERLEKSSNPAIARQAAMMYSSLTQYKEQMAQYDKWQKERTEQAQAEEHQDTTEEPPSPGTPATKAESPTLKQRPRPTGMMILSEYEGSLQKVECSGQRASFTLSGAHPITLTTPDIQQVSFTGKQAFSCDLHGVKVRGFYSKNAGKNQVMTMEFEETATGK